MTNKRVVGNIYLRKRKNLFWSCVAFTLLWTKYEGENEKSMGKIFLPISFQIKWTSLSIFWKKNDAKMTKLLIHCPIVRVISILNIESPVNVLRKKGNLEEDWDNIKGLSRFTNEQTKQYLSKLLRKFSPLPLKVTNKFAGKGDPHAWKIYSISHVMSLVQTLT